MPPETFRLPCPRCPAGRTEPALAGAWWPLSLRAGAGEGARTCPAQPVGSRDPRPGHRAARRADQPLLSRDDGSARSSHSFTAESAPAKGGVAALAVGPFVTKGHFVLQRKQLVVSSPAAMAWPARLDRQHLFSAGSCTHGVSSPGKTWKPLSSTDILL